MITKQALALRYYPNDNPVTARNKLMRCIRGCGGLMQALYQTGYRPHQHTFYPIQQRLIEQYLGEP